MKKSLFDEDGKYTEQAIKIDDEFGALVHEYIKTMCEDHKPREVAYLLSQKINDQVLDFILLEGIKKIK